MPGASVKALTRTRIDDTDPARIAALALANLGGTHDEVAAALAVSGYTDGPGAGAGDVIARYLMASDPLLVAVTVTDSRARLDRADETTEVDLPGPVLGFASRFDMGRYSRPSRLSALLNPLADPGTTGDAAGPALRPLTAYPRSESTV
jgi:hypothetical protein